MTSNCAPVADSYPTLYPLSPTPSVLIVGEGAGHTQLEPANACTLCSVCSPSGTADSNVVLAYATRYSTAFFARELLGDTPSAPRSRASASPPTSQPVTSRSRRSDQFETYVRLRGIVRGAPLADSLDVLLADGVIDEILGRIKSGKEATISMVRRGDAVLAAKVYKDRATRSFKNNVQYKEGRKVRNTRTQRAMDSGGKFGRDSAEQAWKSAEADALYRLVDTGVRTPAPVMFYEGVLLMELVLDHQGRPAPRLEEITLERDAVMGVYCDLRGADDRSPVLRSRARRSVAVQHPARGRWTDDHRFSAGHLGGAQHAGRALLHARLRECSLAPCRDGSGTVGPSRGWSSDLAGVRTPRSHAAVRAAATAAPSRRACVLDASKRSTFARAAAGSAAADSIACRRLPRESATPEDRGGSRADCTAADQIKSPVFTLDRPGHEASAAHQWSG